MSGIVSLSDATFEDAINSGTPVLVDFWAEWCGPCRLIAPILEELSNEQDRFLIRKVDVDANPSTAASNDVLSIPTLILFVDGVEKKRMIGAVPKHKLLSEIGECL